MEQPHAETLAAAVRLQDDRLVGEMAPRGGHDAIAAGHQDGARRGDAVALQGCVLPRLADLQVERARPVDHAPAPAREPCEHGSGQFRGIAMVPRVRRGTHAVVEHALRRRIREVEGPGIEEPIGPGQPALIEGQGQRRQPGGIFMQDVDAAHDRISLALPRRQAGRLGAIGDGLFGLAIRRGEKAIHCLGLARFEEKNAGLARLRRLFQRVGVIDRCPDQRRDERDQPGRPANLGHHECSSRPN